MRYAKLLLLALFALPVAAAVGPIRWTIGRSAEGPSRVQLSIGYTSQGSFGWRRGATQLAELQGLAQRDVEARASRAVRFNIVRDAGTLACEGMFRDERGEGNCTFAANAAFARELERRGIGRPSLMDQFTLAVHEDGLALVDELARQKYARPTVDDLVRASLNGADVALLRELDSAGYHAGTVSRLIWVSNHSISADTIRQSQQRVGWTIGPAGKLDPAGSVEWRVNLSGSRGTGVIRMLGDLEGLSSTQLAAADATTVRYRVTADAGTFDCSGTASARRGSGTCVYTPAVDFASQLEKFGVARPTGEEQLRMAAHGVRLEDVAGYAKLGYRGLTPRTLIDLRIFRVTPAYIGQLAELGYRNVPLETVVDLHMFGVRIADVRAIQSASAKPLALEQVIDLHRERR